MSFNLPDETNFNSSDSIEFWDKSGTNPQKAEITTKNIITRNVENVSDLRNVSSDGIRAAKVTDDTQGGIFIPKQSDPFGNGDNGATVVQASDGTWWVRYKAILGHPINPRWFGAVGNASVSSTGDPVSGTDDTQAFNEAIDFASNNESSRTILVPHGQYRITDQLSVRTSGIEIRAEQSTTSAGYTTVFYCDFDDSAKCVIKLIDGFRDLSLTDLAFDMNNNTTQVIGVDSANNSKGLRIDGLHVNNCHGNGVNLGSNGYIGGRVWINGEFTYQGGTSPSVVPGTFGLRIGNDCEVSVHFVQGFEVGLYVTGNHNVVNGGNFDICEYGVANTLDGSNTNANDLVFNAACEFNKYGGMWFDGTGKQVRDIHINGSLGRNDFNDTTNQDRFGLRLTNIVGVSGSFTIWKGNGYMENAIEIEGYVRATIMPLEHDATKNRVLNNADNTGTRVLVSQNDGFYAYGYDGNNGIKNILRHKPNQTEVKQTLRFDEKPDFNESAWSGGASGQDNTSSQADGWLEIDVDGSVAYIPYYTS